MPQELNKMIDEGIKDTEALERLANDIAGKVTTSQLRKFFGSVKKIEADFEKLKGDVVLLEPQLAHSVGRAKGDAKDGLRKLYDTLKPVIKQINENELKFNRFVKMLEAIVAYHKANPKTKEN